MRGKGTHIASGIVYGKNGGQYPVANAVWIESRKLDFQAPAWNHSVLNLPHHNWRGSDWRRMSPQTIRHYLPSQELTMHQELKTHQSRHWFMIPSPRRQIQLQTVRLPPRDHVALFHNTGLFGRGRWRGSVVGASEFKSEDSGFDPLVRQGEGHLFFSNTPS